MNQVAQGLREIIGLFLPSYSETCRMLSHRSARYISHGDGVINVKGEHKSSTKEYNTFLKVCTVI